MKLPGLGLNLYQMVGVANEVEWAQVRLVEKGGGGLLIVMRLTTPTALQSGGQGEAAARGSELMESLAERFTAAGSKLEWLKQQIDWWKETGSEGEVLLGVVAVGRDGRRGLYLAGWEGGVGAELNRSGRRVRLWPKGEASQVSGWLEDGDELVMGTGNFFKAVWRGNVAEARGTLAGLEETAGVAGMMVKVGEKEEIEERSEQIAEMLGGENKALEWLGKRWGQLWRAREGRVSIKLRQPRWAGRQVGLVLGIGFLVVLGVSVVVGVGRRNIQLANKEYETVAGPIEFALQEAVSLKEVNPARARSLVKEAQEKISEQGERFTQGRLAEKWQELVTKTETTLREVSGEKQIEGQKWLDLAVIKEEMKVDGMLVKDGGIEIWGGQTKTWARVDLKDKSAKVVGGGEELAAARGAAVAAGKRLLLIGEEILVNREGQWVNAADLEGVAGVAMTGFAGNLYLLAKEDVFKYPVVADGWGKRRRFLEAGMEVDVSQGVDLAIDGDIWVLLNDGRVERLSRGGRVEFSLKGMDDWGEPAKLEVSQKLGRVYVLDRGRGRIVVFDRGSGEYQEQLRWDKLTAASDLAIDEEGSRLLVGIDGELWVIGL